MDQPRRLGIVRRFSLAEAADGWNDEHYVIYRPATYPELQEYKKLDTKEMGEDASVGYMVKMIKDHFIKGQVMVLDAKDDLVTGAMVKDDISMLPPDTLGALFLEVIGSKLDPKDIQKAAAAAGKSESDAKPSETLSSTD